MKIVNDKLVAESQEEAVQILKDLGLEPYYKKGDGIAMGILQSEILNNGHDYPVIWDCDCENGAFKVYDDICIAGDKYFLSFIGTNNPISSRSTNRITAISSFKFLTYY